MRDETGERRKRKTWEEGRKREGRYKDTFWHQNLYFALSGHSQVVLIPGNPRFLDCESRSRTYRLSEPCWSCAPRGTAARSRPCVLAGAACAASTGRSCAPQGLGESIRKKPKGKAGSSLFIEPRRKVVVAGHVPVRVKRKKKRKRRKGGGGEIPVGILILLLIISIKVASNSLSRDAK
jgi:hypothetical protein